MALIGRLANMTQRSARSSATSGIDVEKEIHWAYVVDAAGTVLLSKPIANSESELGALMAQCPDDTLVVVDQRRNIGALALRCARAAEKPVAYLPGSAEHDMAKSFPGIAKTDEGDAQVIARTALGMPHTLRPVPKDDSELDGARIMSAQLAQVHKDRTACASALHSRLLESCPSFELACDMTAAWCTGILAEMGGPWNMADAGREKFCACSRKRKASRKDRDGLWNAISGERPSAQAAAEKRYVKHFASRIASDNEAEAEPHAAIDDALSSNLDYANLQTIPGIGPRSAAQLVVTICMDGFSSHDKLTSYCGLAPATQQSGKPIDYEKPS